MYVDFEQGLVALDYVHSFLRLCDMFVYVVPNSHRVNSQSLFELRRRNIAFKLGHKSGTVP